MNIVIYSPTGEILRMVSCPDSMAPLQAQEGESWIEGEASDVTDYVNLVAAPVITPKGDYTLEALPLPCTLTIEGIEYPCTEQPTFSFDPAGIYKIAVDAGPKYLRKTFEYEQL